MRMTDVVIAAYRRSPFHFAGKGELAGVRPDEMTAQVVRALVEATGVDPATVEDLVLGCAFPEGEQGLNMAKLVAFLSGLPENTRSEERRVGNECRSRWSPSHYNNIP